MWFTPRAGPALLAWELEKIKGVGMPDLIEMVKDVQTLGAKLYLCSAAADILGCEQDDLWEGVELKGSTTFVSEAHGASLSLSF
jgi:predicted peroxiredoxin